MASKPLPRVVAVIIGRAGSKGLPGKNALPLPFGGKPTICYSIEHALAATCVQRVIVSTDGRDIARAATARGVEVVDRPADLASDTATVDAAVRHAITSTGERDRANIVVILYANVPARPPTLIDDAVEMLLKTGADSVQSYCDVGKYHPFWMAKIDSAGRVKPNVKNNVYRRQDLPPLYIPDGGVIAVTCENLFRIDPNQPHAFLGVDRRGLVNPAGAVVDIDSAFDAVVAGAMMASQTGFHEVTLAAG
jgi:N-acylneuraminate cytidylyltransferase